MIHQRVVSAVRGWLQASVLSWDRFWFTPRLPHTLSLLRIVTGLMLLYSHLVLATDLMSFLGQDAWINNDTARQLHDGAFGPADAAHSYLWYLSSPTVLWMHHVLALVVTAAFAVGFLTRITAPLAFGMQLMYLHRLTGTLFGLDQIVTYSTMYLMISPCGSCFSVDAWLREKFADRRRGNAKLRWLWPEATPSVAANIATRLLQLHLCVIYLFGGLAKARGQSWWDGTAMWYSVGNYEYQSINMTWLSSWPRVSSAMVHITLCWEIFYCALVWPKLTRPIVLTLAVVVHGGIALSLGMITFGVMMIAANMIFVDPQWMLRMLDRGGDELEMSESELAESLEEEEYEDPLPPDEITGRSVEDREERLRVASRRLRAKNERLRERESKYRQRVKRLKDREKKIKDLVERRRKSRADPDADQD